VADDVIELGQAQIGRRREIRGMETDIADRGFRGDPPPVLDVFGPRIDAVELARRVHRRQYCSGQSQAAPQITPGKSIPPRRRHNARNHGCVVEPGRCQFVNEGADIWNVSYIAVDVSGHRSLQAGPLIELRENIEKFKARWLIATRKRIKRCLVRRSAPGRWKFLLAAVGAFGPSWSPPRRGLPLGMLLIEQQKIRLR
jgi:hypothetical protein